MEPLSESLRLVRRLGMTLVVLAALPAFVDLSPGGPIDATDNLVVWAWDLPSPLDAMLWTFAASGLALAALGIAAQRVERLSVHTALMLGGAISLTALAVFYVQVSDAARSLPLGTVTGGDEPLPIWGQGVLVSLVAGARLRQSTPAHPVGRALLVVGAAGLLYGGLWPQPLPWLGDANDLPALATMSTVSSTADQIPAVFNLRLAWLYLSTPGAPGVVWLLGSMLACSAALPVLGALAAWVGLGGRWRDPIAAPAGTTAVRLLTLAYGPVILAHLGLALFLGQGVLSCFYLTMAVAFATWLATAGHGLSLALAPRPEHAP